MKVLNVNNFLGGLNNRDSLTKLKVNELSDIENLKIREDGSLERREGLVLDKVSAESSIQNIYQWVDVDGNKKLLVVSGGKVFNYDGWAELDKTKSFINSKKLGLLVYYGDLILLDPQNGTFIYKNEITSSKKCFVKVVGQEIIFYAENGEEIPGKRISIKSDGDEKGKKLFDIVGNVNLFVVKEYKNKIFLFDKGENGNKHRIIRLNNYFEYEEMLEGSDLRRVGESENIFYDCSPNVAIFQEGFLFVLKEQNKILRVSYNSFADIKVKQITGNIGKFLINWSGGKIGYLTTLGALKGVLGEKEVYGNIKINSANIIPYKEVTISLKKWGDWGQGWFRVYINSIHIISSFYEWSNSFGSTYISDTDIDYYIHFPFFQRKLTLRVYTDRSLRDGHGWIYVKRTGVKVYTNYGNINFPFDITLGNSDYAYYNQEINFCLKHISSEAGNFKAIGLLNNELNAVDYRNLETTMQVDAGQSIVKNNSVYLLFKINNQFYYLLDDNIPFIDLNSAKKYNVPSEFSYIFNDGVDFYIQTTSGVQKLVVGENLSLQSVNNQNSITLYSYLIELNKRFKYIGSPYTPNGFYVSGGNLQRGKYSYKLSFVFQGDVESPASNPIEVGINQVGSIKLTNIKIPQYYISMQNLEKVKIYRKKEGENDYYFVDEIMPYEEEKQDGKKIRNYVSELEWIDDGKPNNGKYIEKPNPYKFKYGTIHLNRLVLAGDEKNLSIVLYSNVDAIEDIPVSNFREINKDDGDYITGIYSCRDFLYVFKSNNTYAIYKDVKNGQLLEISHNIGCITQNSITAIDDLVFWMDRTGFFMVYRRQVKKISDKIERYFDPSYEEAINMKYVDNTRVIIDKFTNEVIWFVPTGKSERNNLALIYNFKIGCWYKYKYPYEITEATIIEEEDSEVPKRVFGSADGKILKVEKVNNDAGKRINWEMKTPLYTIGDELYQKLFKKVFVKFNAVEFFKLSYTPDLVNWRNEVVKSDNINYSKNQMIRLFDCKSPYIQIKCSGNDYSEPVKIKGFEMYYLPLLTTGEGR